MVTSLQESLKSLEGHYNSLLALSPVCSFGSMVYQLLYQLTERSVWFHLSMKEFQTIFVESIRNEEVIECWKKGGVQQRKSSFEEKFKESLIKAVLTKLLKLVAIHTCNYKCIFMYPGYTMYGCNTTMPLTWTLYP